MDKNHLIPILYEDDYCIIVNKPNHVLVHHSYYSRNVKDDSLLQLLRKQFANQNFYPVHRLDRKTSGVLLLAKKKEFISKFQELFASQHIQKSYYALVRGYTLDNGIIDTPIKNPDTGIYKQAKTLYKKISQVELKIPVTPYSTSRYSIIELTPKTGRMHQLRKHMNKIAHPIIGDHKYGNRHHNQMFEYEFGLNFLFLHAYALEFQHPFSYEMIKIKTKPPQFWSELLNRLNWAVNL